MRDNYTHITIVSDRSGSMYDIREDAEGGINKFLEDHKAHEGDATLLFLEFDTTYNTVYGPGPIKDAKPYSLVPRGMTALYDAVFRGITETGEYLAKMDEADRPANVIFVIVTDGAENSSHEVTYQQVADAIKRQQDDYSWVFTFLASGVSAVDVARSLHIPQHHTTQMAGTGASYAGTTQHLSSSVAAARTAGRAGGSSFSVPKSVAADGTVEDPDDDPKYRRPVSNRS